MTTTRVDVEDIESTRSEKFLAVVLMAFLLIGTIWFYVKVDDWLGPDGYRLSATEQRVIDEHQRTEEIASHEAMEVEDARGEMQLAKDALDIALAKGEQATAEEQRYQVTLQHFRTEQAEAAQAAKVAEAARAEADAVYRAQEKEGEDEASAWLVAGIRFAFIVGWFVASLQLLNALRRKRSRYLPVGFSAVATGVVTALVFATDYITDYIDPLDLGPVVLSVVGAGATIAAFVGLQRWLARRIPGRRVRNRECPYCGHPHKGTEPYCEGCGREVVAACASCGEQRRVGATHCAHCGQE